MTKASAADAALAPAARLEPDAIGVAQDTVIGMASSAPGVSVGLTLAALALATAYAGGLVIVVTAIPMLIIANAYRRLNMWSANCGASFEWVGRSISPYLGWLTGWLMIAAYVTGAVSGVEVIGPNVLAVISSRPPGGPWADISIATVITLAMLVIAVAGIRLTARTQVAMAVAEYAILAGFAITGLVLVLRHAPGTFPVTPSWFSLSGIHGHGSLAAGLLIAVYIYSGWDGTYSGWDGTLYVKRGGQAPPGQSWPRRHARGSHLDPAVRAGHHRAARRRVTGPAAGPFGRCPRLRRAGDRRHRVGQGHGARAGLVGDRRDRNLDRAHRQDRVRDGILAGTARPTRQHLAPVRHARQRQHPDRRPGDRADLGVPAGHLDPGRVHRRGERQRPAVRRVLHPHCAGHYFSSALSGMLGSW